ncbi:class I SAM-dependent DNA methyltransferase [Luteimonas granuli]|uniref:site-specific DNA-methyltransferase (adenine-specific) n=1 Tax=Luteimonas granuli TaxID=1176533 RepID=A0A518N7D5_9GAMM|nr:class I SAM-dependent DNA methyltransferase [Luteimonas granuli]
MARWEGVTASELSTSQSFLIDLCRLLDVEVPHPTPEQDYMFERPITFRHGDGGRSAGRIDLYRRGAFVLESKKVRLGAHTKGFDDALLRARSQAEAYARALPADEGRPPFVVVVDVGQRIELYSEFSRSGGTYVPFPDPRSHRIALADLRRPELRERLRRVWTDPLGLDPSRESARVTRQIADRLATLARSLEQGGFDAEAVAQFLMRCLFTMFAEDVKLLPAHSFRDLLARHGEQPDVAMRMLAQLWRDMDAGGFSAVLAGNVLRFNGKLFKQPDTLPLDAAQIALLLDAARADWKHVEPAIFGTLLERALSPKDRHKLGAHYTPRAYVERLVLPTVIEPLRREWSDAQAAAGTLADEGKADEAIAELKRFHHRLCTVRVLDPACGSGNFLYVTLEHLKRLEGEVLNALDELGDRQTGLALGGERADAAAGETVDPHNLLGIELNPRAAAIAEVVLWIGYLQWHYRTRGDVHPPQPVIRDFRNIENRDAVLAHDGVEFVTDERGVPVTRWDGETMKVSPVTGEQVPDEAARKPVERYRNPRKAAWPEADFVVGNPPFIGSKRMRELLGDGYVDALQEAWPEVPQATDFVMRWWHHAALLARKGAIQRFGFITTNSLRQAYVRRAVEPHLKGEPPLSLVAAIPDHPWVDTADGAAVRIAMTVGEGGRRTGRVGAVVEEHGEASSGSDDLVAAMSTRTGRINADLTVGVDVTQARALRANAELSSVGMKTIGAAFQIDRQSAVGLGLFSIPGLEAHVRPYINGRDLSQTPREIFVIDFYGLEAEEVRARYPAAYQHLLERAKPERDQNRNALFRDRWWVIGHPRQQFRAATEELSRYIATLETSKHRFFSFLPIDKTPDSSLVTIADPRGETLGVLSSVLHVVWALATGGRLGVGNDPRYNKSRCFETFPFPNLNAADKFGGPVGVSLVNADGTTGEVRTFGEYPSDRICKLAEELDAHRKRQQSAHPGLTLTGMYNVLDKLRSGEVLTAKERTIREQGLVSVLRQLHDELDEAVLYAYNWGDLIPLLRVAHGNESPDTLQQFAEAERDLRPTERPLDGGPASTREEAKRAFEEAVLERLVALNAERAAEEARGHIRWLRPEFQNPEVAREKAPEQARFTSDDAGEAAEKIDESSVPLAVKPLPWPKDTVDQVRAVADLLAASPVPLSIDEIATRFTARGPWKKRLPKLVEMLVALGRAQEQEGGYVAG